MLQEQFQLKSYSRTTRQLCKITGIEGYTWEDQQCQTQTQFTRIIHNNDSENCISLRLEKLLPRNVRLEDKSFKVHWSTISWSQMSDVITIMWSRLIKQRCFTQSTILAHTYTHHEPYTTLVRTAELAMPSTDSHFVSRFCNIYWSFDLKK